MARPKKVPDELDGLTAELRSSYGMLMTPNNVRALLKCGRQAAADWLKDVDCVLVGQRRRYQTADVARKLLHCRERRLAAW